MIAASAAFTQLKENLYARNEKHYCDIIRRADQEVKEAVTMCNEWVKIHIGDLDLDHTVRLFDYMAQAGYTVYQLSARNTRYMILLFSGLGNDLPTAATRVRTPIDEHSKEKELWGYIDKEAEAKSLMEQEWDE